MLHVILVIYLSGCFIYHNFYCCLQQMFHANQTRFAIG